MSIASNSVRSASLAVVAVFVLTGAAQAGCKINLTLVNDDSRTYRIFNDSHNDTSVKTKGGVWRDLRKGHWFGGMTSIDVGSGADISDVYEATFGCSKKRRFRIDYRCASGGNKRVTYYPGPNSWTERQDVTIHLDNAC